MDTAEEQRQASESPFNAVYDGFMSYSHAADDLLAPRLQAGLQRFAKPWWKRRAIRIFRDEASLSANPHLWSSITEALDQADWFVLLLSPEAADSVWVNREVDYWLEHKDPNRVIPVVTDGEFGWSAGDIDPGSNSAPPALYGVFSDEPRWVDLRFARTEEQLDLRSASFRAAVADIASAIRGVPKDELESEEIRQHRRTRRTAAAAGVALLVLALAAIGAALFAINQRNEARDATAAETEARQEAEAAATGEAEARTEADAQRDVAEQLAFDARSDALAASAIAQLDADPQLALLLATEALQREAQPAALTATHQALQRHRTLFQIEVAAGSPLAGVSGAVGGMSPAGDMLAVTGLSQDLEVWEVGGDQPIWTVRYPGESTVVLSASFTEDGGAVVAHVAGLESDSPVEPTELHVFDAATGREVTSIEIPGMRRALFRSPMAPYVDLTTPLPWVINPGFGPWEAGFLDPQTGSFSEVSTISQFGAFAVNGFGVPTSDSNRRYFAVGTTGPGQVIDLETGELVFSFDRGNSTLSDDGSLLLAEGYVVGRPLELWDLASQERLWAIDSTFTRAWFSGDQTMVYGTSLDGSTYVLDTATGDQLFRLTSGEGAPLAAVMSSDGRRLATFSTDFTARVSDLGAIQSEGTTYVTTGQPRVQTAASADLAGGVVAVWGGAAHQEETLWETTVVDLSSGETLVTVTGGVPALSPDGTMLAYRAVDEVEVTIEDLKGQGQPGMRPWVGPVRIVDVNSGDLILEIEVPCQQYLMPAGVVHAADCFLAATGGLEWDLEFSPDGRMLGMVDSYDRVVTIWDTTTGQVISRTSNRGVTPRAVAFTPDSLQVVTLSDPGFLGGDSASRQQLNINDISEPDDIDLYIDPVLLFGSEDTILIDRGIRFAEMVFTADGSLLVAAASNGEVLVVDATTWQQTQPITAHDGAVLDVAVNEANTLIASAGVDAYVRVWNLADYSLVTEITFDVDQIANVEFIDDTHLFVTPGFGNEAIVITLDPDELLEIAQSRLTRSFTEGECATYGIEPCPTLDEIRGG